MVTYTSTTSMRTALIDTQSAAVDRHRPALSFSPIPASHILDSLIDVRPRTMPPGSSTPGISASAPRSSTWAGSPGSRLPRREPTCSW